LKTLNLTLTQHCDGNKNHNVHYIACWLTYYSDPVQKVAANIVNGPKAQGILKQAQKQRQPSL
jgi:hypothetical protein